MQGYSLLVLVEKLNDQKDASFKVTGILKDAVDNKANGKESIKSNL